MTTEKIDPLQHEIPEGYEHWDGDNAEDHNGPFFYRMEGEVAHTLFRVKPHNCNGHGILHGGVMMMFADFNLCVAAIGGSRDAVVTVTCNNEFVGPAFEGDLIEGRGELICKGGSLIFTRSTLTANGKTILTSSGVIKRLRQSS